MSSTNGGTRTTASSRRSSSPAEPPKPVSALARLTRPELVFPDLPGSDSPTVLRALADRVAPYLPGSGAEELYHKLQEREELGSTGIGDRVAIPHCKIEGLDDPLLAIAVVPGGIDFHAVDERMVQLFFLLVSPADTPAAHLQVLANISRWVKNDRHVERILDRPDREAIYKLLDESS
jgi:PTS system nitrogen regulatory IIA component